MEFGFADELNSQARQASAERAWSAISRFYENCKAKIPGKKGYPKFKHNSRSVEYKTSGWKLDSSRRYIKFTDGKNIGKLKLVGTRDLNFYQVDQIKHKFAHSREFCWLSTTGYVGTWAQDALNAWGDEPSTRVGESLHGACDCQGTKNRARL